MIFDSSKLKGLIREKGLTQEIVAKKIGIAYSTFNLKLNGTLYFTQEEIFNISNVLEITVNGNQMFQVGNTVIFAEDGLDMVEDFETPDDIAVDSGGGFVPLDRFINNIKNDIGKEKTIIISSQMGIPIGVYQGEKVYVTVPDNLPKMTRLNIDGKSLYIHRANYLILDTKSKFRKKILSIQMNLLKY